MVLGVDVGYYATKVYGEYGRDIFLSTVQEGSYDYNDSIVVEFEGKTYTVGERSGDFTVDTNKIDNEVFKICLFTAIARSIKDDAQVYLATGLPIQYYSKQKEALKKSLDGLGVAIKYNSDWKNFIIEDVVVYPQGAGLAVLESKLAYSPTIITDIGGHTTDVSVFNGGKLLSKATYENGMLSLYGKVVQEVKAQYGVSYDILDAYGIITSKKIVVDGRSKHIEDIINPILKNHTIRAITNIKNDFKEFDSYSRIFMGGGSMLLKDYLPHGSLIENVYANAEIFYRVGVEEFEG